MTTAPGYEGVRREEAGAPKQPVDLTAKWDALKPLTDAPDAVRAAVEALAASKRITFDSLLAQDCRYSVRKGGAIVLHWAGRTADGMVCGIRNRPLDPEKRKDSVPGSTWPMPLVFGKTEQPERVYITEGETDSARISILDPEGLVLSFPSGVGRGKHWKAEWRPLLPEHVPVYVALDNDKAGQQTASVVLNELPGAALLRPVGAIDWCEWEGDSDDFTTLRLQAVKALVIPGPDQPMAVARSYVADQHLNHLGLPTLVYHRGYFHRYLGTHWTPVLEADMRTAIWRWLENCLFTKTNKTGATIEPFNPKPSHVSAVLDALMAVVNVEGSRDLTPPLWLARREEIKFGQLAVMQNGILDLRTRELAPHTANLFNEYALPFSYDPDAPPPARWLRFLDELWGEDEQAKELLAEWFGYVVSGDTSRHKMMLIVGPPRSGKGTIGRTLTSLVGEQNVSSTTLHNLGTLFGLQGLVGKVLATIPDARFGKSDSSGAVERLLSISGEDVIDIQIKYHAPWVGRLGTRFMIMTNEVPSLLDSSGAFASRFLLLTTTKSFLDSEDYELEDKLRAELPGIFNWAFDGLDRLRERGRFVIPESSALAVQELKDLSSPISAFVRERCVVGPDYAETKDVLWTAWKAWCEEEGRSPGTKAIFGKNLHALGISRHGRTMARSESTSSTESPSVRAVRVVPHLFPDRPATS
jgi:putative DNA primase/helicase